MVNLNSRIINAGGPGRSDSVWDPEAHAASQLDRRPHGSHAGVKGPGGASATGHGFLARRRRAAAVCGAGPRSSDRVSGLSLKVLMSDSDVP